MIFIDTGAFVARHRKSDAWHQLACDGWDRIRDHKIKCFTTNLVLVESSRILRAYLGAIPIARLLSLWLQSELVQVLRSAADEELEAVELMVKFADQDISFVDAVSFVLMKRYRLRRAFAFDRDFQIAGFDLWPTGRSR